MEQKIKRVYIDSSVVYGAPAKEFSEDSKRFWDAFRNGEFALIVSDVLIDEMNRAPAYVRKLFAALPESNIERVDSTKESDRLALQYIAEDVVGTSSLDDCRHIAVATFFRADVLVSWNFAHVINRRAGYNDVNEKQGYTDGIEIQTPKKFMETSHGEN